MNNVIKNIEIGLLFVFCIITLGCRKSYPTPEDMKNYTIYIQNGDLENVKNYYKKFGKGFLNTYGSGLYSINPLEYALYFKKYDIADFFIENGADVNGLSPTTGKPIIFTGIYNNDIEFVKYLIDKKAKLVGFSYPLITSAVFENNLKMTELILENTNFIDEQDENGYTALYIASGNGNMEIVKFLIEHGANINLVDNSNSTPLSIAVMNEHIQVAEYLIEHGADTSIKDNEGLDALWFANELGLTVKGLNS